MRADLGVAGLLAVLALAVLAAGEARAGASPVRFASSDRRLAEAFDWARRTAMRYVGKDNDPVGPWYEAALPGREAFCIRDVSHQCIGAEILGLGRQNANMFRRFVEGISERRDYCSFWEIDRRNRPAPVDYESDGDFWYTLNANFDILDACWRLYQWTGDVVYIRDPAFDRFFRLTLHEYVERWQLQPDRIMDRPASMNLRPSAKRFRLARGIPSYDEGQGDLAVGSDLVGIILNGYRTYARILQVRGEADRAAGYARKAQEYRHLLDTRWWDERSQSYRGFYTTHGEFHDGGVSGAEFLLWYRAVEKPDRILRSLRSIRNTQVEVLSYLPALYYRYGLDEEGCALLLKLAADPRRDYPEAPFGALEALVCGLMGIEPAASEGVVRTCPHLTAATAWAAVEDLPTFAGPIGVRHDGTRATAFTNGAARAVTWRAVFPGRHAVLEVDGTPRPAKHSSDALKHELSYVDVAVGPGGRSRAAVPEAGQGG